jgi:hypothetical protein
VKGVRLSAPGGGGCLFLVTAQAEVALALNEAVRAAGWTSIPLLAGPAPAEPTPEPAAPAVALDLFLPAPGESPPPAPGPPTPHAVAGLLLARCRGRTLSWGELVRELAEGQLTAAEIRAGLLRLRREGWASFGSLRGAGAYLTLYPERRPPPLNRKARTGSCDLFCACPLCRGASARPGEEAGTGAG